MVHTGIIGQQQRKKKGDLEEGFSQEQGLEFDTAVWCEEGGCTFEICGNDTVNI